MLYLIISCVALMLVYMCIGFVLCKSGKADVTHAKGMSGLLIYVLGPAMIINSFLQLEYSADNVIKLGKYFLVSLAVQLIFFGLLFLVFGKKYEDSKYRILTVGSVLGNVGFLGMPVIASVCPEYPIVQCYSSINVMSMNLIVFTVGVFMITNDKQYISVKSAVLNPTTIAIIISVPLFIWDINFNESFMSAINILAKMTTPVCMIILGMRLSASKLNEVFRRPFVYATCALKLVAFPLLALLLVKWLPFLDNAGKTTVVVLAMMPSGAIIESLAELHECEQELAANVVLLTTILSVITIPIMTYLLV